MISSEEPGTARLVAHIAFAPSEWPVTWKQWRPSKSSCGRPRRRTLTLPAGYSLLPVGSFQNQIEANRRLMVIIPIVILVDLLIIYLNFRNLPLTLIIFSQIPIAIFGGMIGLGLFDIEMNTAIWVGLIALIGIAEDDGVVIATYMEQLFARRPLRTRPGHPRRDGRSRPAAHPSLLDDGVHDVCGIASRDAGDRPRGRRGSGDGVAGVLRHVRRAGVAVRRAGALLRLHGIQAANGRGGSLVGDFST